MQKDPRVISLLVIEDNPGDFLLTEEYLNDILANVILTNVPTYREAYELLSDNAHLFDAILLDLTLPDMDGEELINNMLEVADATPIIVLTGHRDLEFSIKTLSSGISDYLLKDELSPTLLYKSIVYSIERRAFSAKVLQSEKSYRDLFDLSPLPMWLFDLETLEFLDVNSAAVEHYGYSKEEFLSMTIREIRPPDQDNYLQTVLEQIRTVEKMAATPALHQKKNGELIHVMVQGNETIYNGRKARIILAVDITEQKQQEKELINSLHEKETLLAEIHHRVKNNLAVVSAMMQLQAEQVGDVKLNQMLFDSIRRIRTMANIHEHLYRSESFSRVNFSESIHQLIKEIVESGSQELSIDIIFSCDLVQLNINQAVPCSLIANEVTTNIIKHAFGEEHARSPRIEASMKEREEKVTLTIEDNGTGLPDSVSADEPRTLGIQLIDSLVRQLEGTYQYQAIGEGTRFRLTFQKSDLKGAVSAHPIA
ncbi:MAG: histidine kinase dimerization/phosphoacceptor domain -containing protein [Balneolaceae bacterium]